MKLLEICLKLDCGWADLRKGQLHQSLVFWNGFDPIALQNVNRFLGVMMDQLSLDYARPGPPRRWHVIGSKL